MSQSRTGDPTLDAMHDAMVIATTSMAKAHAYAEELGIGDELLTATLGVITSWRTYCLAILVENDG